MGNSLDDLSIGSISGGYSKYSSTDIDPSKDASDSSYMDFDSYLKVLAAKMSNQDFNDPMSDSEMLQQMASYSMLEGIKNMTNQSNISYASSLVGKAVTVNDGENYDTGLVEAVIIKDGKPYLSINGGLYEWNKVTDICDNDIYYKLSALVGRQVDVSTTDKDGNPYSDSGTITNVIFVGGSALVVVDGKNAYPLNTITVRPSEKDESSEGGDGGDDADDGSTGSGTDSVTGTDTDTGAGSGSADNIVNEDAVASSDLTSGSYKTQSEALFDELMSTIDAISGRVTETSGVNAASMNPVYYEDLLFSTASFQVPDYAAGVFANPGTVDQTLSLKDIPSVDASKVDPLLGSSSSSSGSAISGSSPASGGSYYDYSSSYSSSYGYSDPEYEYITVTASNFYDVLSRSNNGRISDTLSNSDAYDLIASGNYSARFSPRFGLELRSDTRPGISTSDCVPHRLDADKYPSEAALADSLGTRMYDIKYINNTAVNSRISTSGVIAETVNGEQVTEIGFSGKGQLGEVVTFKDGTQRVEIILNNGHSTWLRTSGRYTINEICSLNVAPGSLAGKFTSDEDLIRFYGTNDDLNRASGIKS